MPIFKYIHRDIVIICEPCSSQDLIINLTDSITFLIRQKATQVTVTYIWDFIKGTFFLWPLMLSQRGHVFIIFPVARTYSSFWPKGPWPNPPELKTST